MTSCKKQIDQTVEANIYSSSAVSMTQIKQWESSFLPTLNDQPTLAYDLAQKKMVNGRPYVRVPTYGAGSECGYFYFTNKEDGTLQSMFVLVDQKVNSTLDGIVGFTDFENQSQIFVTYQNNKPVALYSVKDTKTLFASVFTKRISGSIRQQQVVSACAEQNGIIKLPDGRDSISIIKMGGGIPCPDTQTFWQKIGNFFSGIWGAITDAFDWLFSWGGGGGSGSGSGSGGSGGYTGGGFGSGGYGSWGFGGFGGGYSGSGSGGSYGGGDPNGGGWGPYDPFANNEDEEITYDDTNSGYEEPNSNSGDDVTPYDQINPSQPIPTINDIMGVTNFVKRVSSSENCFDIAKKQILKLGYYINGWDPARTTFQLYTRSAGINKNKADVGVSYMVSALKRNIPVVIGVDYGKTSGNKDHTTNHFVVVVGMGTDANGKMFFRFYDNYTAATNYGAHPLNIVTYDPNTGSLTGAFVGTRGNNPISYKVAQIRKSFK